MGREVTMSAVLKFKIPVYTGDHGEVELPAGARILSVGTQVRMPDEEEIFLWALVEPAVEEVREKVALCVVGTGHPLPPDADPDKFIGTVHFKSQPLVFHVFEARHG
jgi:hypothetical protein